MDNQTIASDCLASNSHINANALITNNISVVSDRFAIGINDQNSDPNNGNFPPHNIEQLDENHFVLTLAIAGFTKQEIDLSHQPGLLVIKGKKEPDNEVRYVVIDTPVPEDRGGGVIKSTHEVRAKYLYRGIAFRDFQRQFRLGADIEVRSATIENGMLIIVLTRAVREKHKAVRVLID